MDPSKYHTLSPAEAIAYQRELAQKINLKPLDTEIRSIAGADISFNKYSNIVYAGIVRMSYPALRITNKSGTQAESTFPYIPGLLAFREVPALLKAWNLLTTYPDVLILDGQGIAHPRRMGIATHFGLLADVPTLGIAKKHLFGQYTEPAAAAGSYTTLMHKAEQIGWVYRTKENCKPIFISPGHRLSLEQSLTIVQCCLGKYRIPGPTRQAHHWVNELRMSDAITTIQTRLFD